MKYSKESQKTGRKVVPQKNWAKESQIKNWRGLDRIRGSPKEKPGSPNKKTGGVQLRSQFLLGRLLPDPAQFSFGTTFGPGRAGAGLSLCFCDSLLYRGSPASRCAGLKALMGNSWPARLSPQGSRPPWHGKGSPKRKLARSRPKKKLARPGEPQIKKLEGVPSRAQMAPGVPNKNWGAPNKENWSVQNRDPAGGQFF